MNIKDELSQFDEEFMCLSVDFHELSVSSWCMTKKALGGRAEAPLSAVRENRQRLAHMAFDAEREKLIAQKVLLIKEMRHRIANSLQLIANTLLVRAQEVTPESRPYLIDAHERIVAIAEMQKQLNLDGVENGEEIEAKEYLNNLCKWLSKSVIDKKKPVTIEVAGVEGRVPAATAISMGLVATELVINALKHAFPGNRPGHIVISHEKKGNGWSLSVSDDGVAKSSTEKKESRPGLGTSIIGALAKQLHAVVQTKRSDRGTRVTLVHASA